MLAVQFPPMDRRVTSKPNSLRSRRGDRSVRMSAAQLLSFQSCLYSQTSIQPQQSLTLCLQKVKTEVSAGSTPKKSSLRANVKSERRSAPSRNTRLQQEGRGQKGEGQDIPRKGRKEAIQVETSTADLNWQQISFLGATTRGESDKIPAWASRRKTFARTTLPISPKEKRRSKPKCDSTGPPSKTKLLPPLRFSSTKGQAAWRFVLPSPKPSNTNDLPAWLQGKRESLVVTLGSHAQSSLVAASPPSSPGWASEESSDSDAVTTTASKSSSHKSDLDSHSRSTSIGDLTTNMASSSSSISIYAGPTFSCAAPLPSQLPVPSFLLKT